MSTKDTMKEKSLNWIIYARKLKELIAFCDIIKVDVRAARKVRIFCSFLAS